MPNATVFSTVYEWNASKTAELFASLTGVVLSTPFLFYVTWYERCGANHNRTLINQVSMLTNFFLPH